MMEHCPKGVAREIPLVVGSRACGGRPMITDLALVGVGAFLILVALIWKAYRAIDERLGEIQADISELHNGVSQLFLLASTKAKTSIAEPATAVHKIDHRALLR